jgi:hypothetical protein
LLARLANKIRRFVSAQSARRRELPVRDLTDDFVRPLLPKNNLWQTFAVFVAPSLYDLPGSGQACKPSNLHIRLSSPWLDLQANDMRERRARR